MTRAPGEVAPGQDGQLALTDAVVVLVRADHVEHAHDRSHAYTHGLTFEPLESPDPTVRLERAEAGEGRVIRILGSESLDILGMGHCMDYPGSIELRRQVGIAVGGEHTSLGAVAGYAANRVGLELQPDPMPEQNLFIRSDHYAFVLQGIPSVTGFPTRALIGVAAAPQRTPNVSPPALCRWKE